ncbi:MAG: TolC family protein [Myxococcota bacterium]
MIWGWCMTAAWATPASIGLVEALDHADLHNPRIEAATWETEGARAALRQATGFAPDLKVSGSVVRFDRPIGSPIAGLDDPLLVRPQQFATFSASAVAPLTGLVALSGGYQARRHQLQAQRHDERSLRDAVAVQVVEAYTGALAAEALVEVTDAVVASLTSTRDRIAAFESAGLAQRTDVLRIGVALRDAEQSARSARRSLELARRGLALVVGHDAESLVPEPVEPPDIEVPDLDEGLARVSTRADVAAAEESVAAARAGRRARIATLLPQIDALAQFDAFSQIGVFGVPNQWQVALKADFDVFQLGRRNATVRAATTKIRQAEVGSRALRARAELDARAAWNRLASALESVEVAELQIAQASENLRLVDARFEVQLASTADRLDAEQLLAQSRVQEVVARHEVIAALAGWQRQTALPIDPGGTP